MNRTKVNSPEGNANGGIKFDGQKPPISLIPRQAIEQEAAVMAFGADKYGRNNWRKGLHYSRLIDAAMRHILAFADGEDSDPETGLSHAAHARCCLGMLLAMPKEWDDRVDGINTVKVAQNPSKPEFNSEPSCLDAAYERLAMQQGLVTNPVFPENQREDSHAA